MDDSSRRIKLNIGGIIYQTTKNTLLFDSNSRLSTLVLERDENQNVAITQPGLQTVNPNDKDKPQEEEIFIDRDGTHFRYLLNYLRTGHLVLPKDKIVLNEILIEAQYFNIKGVVDELSKPCYRSRGILPQPDELEAFSESLILDKEKGRNLVAWIGGEGKRCSLLYRATRDGWNADDFHFLCDGRSPTVVVVRKGSSVFGGYTEQSWAGNGCKTDNNAFLFSLSSPSGLGPVKIPLYQGEEEDAIFCHPGQGPVFGKGRDLVISDQADRSNCSSRLGNTYKCPAKQVATVFLAGTLTFTVSELEVYEYANISVTNFNLYSRKITCIMGIFKLSFAVRLTIIDQSSKFK